MACPRDAMEQPPLPSLKLLFYTPEARGLPLQGCLYQTSTTTSWEKQCCHLPPRVAEDLPL